MDEEFTRHQAELKMDLTAKLEAIIASHENEITDVSNHHKVSRLFRKKRNRKLILRVYRIKWQNWRLNALIKSPLSSHDTNQTSTPLPHCPLLVTMTI